MVNTDKLCISAVAYCISKNKCVGDYKQERFEVKGHDISNLLDEFESKVPRGTEVIVDYGYALLNGVLFNKPKNSDIWSVYGTALIKKQRN